MISVCLCETLLLPLLSPNHITKLFMLHNRQATTTHPYTHTHNRLMPLRGFWGWIVIHPMHRNLFRSIAKSSRIDSRAWSRYRHIDLPTYYTHKTHTHISTLLYYYVCPLGMAVAACRPFGPPSLTLTHSLVGMLIYIHTRHSLTMYRIFQISNIKNPYYSFYVYLCI